MEIMDLPNRDAVRSDLITRIHIRKEDLSLQSLQIQWGIMVHYSDGGYTALDFKGQEKACKEELSRLISRWKELKETQHETSEI